MFACTTHPVHGTEKMKWLLLIAISSLTLVLGLAAGCRDEEPPTSNPTATAAKVSEPSPQAPGEDIAFSMEEEYRLGEPVEIAIRNNSNVNYYYQGEYPACYNLQFFDDSQVSHPDPYAFPVTQERVLSPGRFIVPQGTHCDIIFEKSLKPGQSVVLFTWDQQMCIKDRWGCIESVPVEPGEYLIRGKFSPVAGVVGFGAHQIPGYVIFGKFSPVEGVVGFGANQTPGAITTVTWGFTIVTN